MARATASGMFAMIRPHMFAGVSDNFLCASGSLKCSVQCRDHHLLRRRINDVIFALHACAATALVIGQCFVYERGNQKLSHTCLAITAAIVLGCCGLLVAAQSSMVPEIQTLDFMYVIGYIKVCFPLLASRFLTTCSHMCL